MSDTQINLRLSVSGDSQVTEAAGRAARAVADIGRAGQVSAAQTAAAMRTLPAQFTDIATSLAGGQSPLTVLLQQGGQIKDSFGGVGAAARALGGYVAGLVNPVTVAAAAVGTLALAYRAGASEAEAFQRQLILSGNVAGVTDGQLARMSATIKGMGAGTQGRAAEVLASIASSSEIGADGMVRFTAAALRLESVGGPAAEKTADAFRQLGREPLAAALKLNETTNFLSVSVYEQVRALEAQGRTTEAARLAQEAYAGAIESRVPQMAATLGYVERAWLSIKNATKGAFDAALNIGRGNTLDGQIEALRQRIESAETGIYSRDKVPELRQELALLQEQQRMLQRGAEADAARAATVKAMAEWDKLGARYQADGKKLAEEILAIRRTGLEAGKSEAQINELIADAVERVAGKKGGAGTQARAPEFKAAEDAARAYMAAMSGLASITQDADAKALGLSKTQARLAEIQASPAWASYSRQQREQVITQAAAAQAAEDLAAGTRLAAEAARDYGKHLAQLERGAATVRGQVQALQDEETGARMAASGRISLAEAIEEVTIARLRDQQVAALGNPDAVLAIQREIDARIELRGLLAGQAQRKASDEAAKGAATEWARTADKIEQSLTDALMNGGKSGADYIKGLFRSMVLRPVISAVTSPISGAISGAIGGALGLGATSAAAGGLSAGAGAGLAGAGLLGGAFGAFGSGVASGLTAWGAGGSVTGLLGTGSALFSGGIASGVGTLVGALGPIALGAGAIYALAKSLDNGGTPHVGSIYGIGTDGRNGATLTRQTAGGYQLGTTFSAAGNSSPEIRSTVAQFTTSLAATFGAAMQTFGLRQGDVRAGFAADNDDPSAGRITIRGADGRVLADSFARYAASASKGFEEFAADAGRVLRDALVAADLPGWADGLLVDLGSRPTIEAVQAMVQSIAQLRGVFDAFGGTLGLTQTEVVGLAKAFGGAAELANGLNGYLASMYTDSERLAMAQRSLSSAFGQLGQSVPANAAAYRALVDAQDLNTEAGRNAYAAMIKLAPAFAEVTAAAEQAAAEQTAAYRQALEDQANAAQRIADERAGLEKQLLELQGDTAALREREIAALDPSNQALQRRINALADEKQRIEALASAGQGIGEFLRDLSTVGANGAPSLAALRAAYAGDLAAAQSGDPQASARLPASARALLDAVRNNASTAIEVAQESSRIAAQLQALPATEAWEQMLAENMAAVRANTAADGAIAKAVAASGAQVARGLIDSAAVRNVVFDASDPLQSIFTATRLAAEGTLDLLTKASNGTLGLYVNLSRHHNADGAMDIGVNMMRGWSAWGGAGIPIRSNGFAAGGTHAGGLRIVGENGPELEVTGPARIYSAAQTARLLSGASDQNAMLAELQAQRIATARLEAELRALNTAMQGLRIEAQAAAVNTNKSTRQLQEVIDRGLTVRTDADTPLATVAA